MICPEISYNVNRLEAAVNSVKLLQTNSLYRNHYGRANPFRFHSLRFSFRFLTEEALSSLKHLFSHFSMRFICPECFEISNSYFFLMFQFRISVFFCADSSTIVMSITQQLLDLK